MFRKICLFVVIVGLLSTSAYAEDWARKMFKETEHDFGSVARNSKAEYRFKLNNIYMEDVHIASVRSSCGCTSPSIEKQWLKTYEDGAIFASINTPTFLGSKGATLTVTFDKPYYTEVQLHVRVFIRDDVAVQPGSVQLGSVDEGAATDKQVAVTHSGDSRWRIEEVRSANPHITATAVPRGRQGSQITYDLKVHLDDQAPAGYINDHLMLVTNDGRSQQIPVLVEGRVTPSVSVSPGSLFMGVVQPGKTVTKKLIVRGKKPFRILSVVCDDDSFKFDVPNENDEKKMVHIVPVTFVAGDDSGRVLKKIRIETDLGTMAPQLDAYAVIDGHR